MSKSQIGQDLNVVNFYREKQNGFFVDIGANDGLNLSNSYFLESQYNWKGICCEPVPYIYEQLVQNRPNAICINDAVYHSSDLTVVFDIARDTLYSGISENIDTWKECVDRDKTTITVNTISLNDLLDKNNAPSFIEYISLDTEGSEYEILRTCDFNKYTFGLIDVEHNYQEPRRSQIKELLLSNGYVYVGENNWDDMYKHHSV